MRGSGLWLGLSLNGGYLVPRTHTCDPQRPVDPSEIQQQLSEWSGRTGRQPSVITSVDAVSGGDWDEEPVCTG